MIYKRIFFLILLFSIIISIGIASANDINETFKDTANQPSDDINENNVELENNLLANSENHRTIYVNQNATSEGDGSIDNPYKSLNQACNNLSGEEQVEINIVEGDYYLDSDLKFNTSSLFINGVGGKVTLKNLNNETHSSLGLISPLSNFTFSNIIFDANNINKQLFYVFKDSCNLGVFNNCTFTNFNNTLMFTSNFNKQFNSCNFINSTSSYFTLTRLYKDLITEFNYCIVSSSYEEFAEKIYLGSKISFNNIWFGQNILPNYIYPPFTDVYESIDYQAYVYGYEIPVTRHAIFKAHENYLGNNTYEIIGILVWNDTTTEGMDKLNPMTVTLSSSTGNLSTNTAILENGTFKVIYKSNHGNNKVKVTLDSEVINLNFYDGIEVACDTIYYGESQNINVTLPQSKGILNITVDYDKYIINVTTSSFNYTIPKQLSAGSHQIKVLFADKENHYYGSVSTELTILKNNFEILVSTPAEAYVTDDTIYLGISLPKDANGNITIIVKDKNLTQDVNGGEININISSLIVGGDNQVIVTYNGNEKYLNQSKSAIVSVDRVNPNMNITLLDTAKINETINLTIVLPDDARGNITIYANSKNITQKINGGENNINISSLLIAGNNFIKVVYSGDEYYASQIKSNYINVLKITPQLIINFKNNVYVDEVFTINVNMPEDITGNFTVKVGDKIYLFNINSQLKVSCNREGLNIINITYNGDDKYYPQSLLTNITAEKISISLNNRKLTVDNGKISINLPNDVTGEFIAKISGKTYTGQLVSGSGTINIENLNPGTYNAIITYNGNNKYCSFSQSISFTVKDKTIVSKLIASKKTFKVKTKTKKYSIFLKTKSGKAIKKVKITLKIKKKTYKATTNNKGKATFKITKLNKKGKYTAVIKFNGNNLYKAVSKKVKIIVKK